MSDTKKSRVFMDGVWVDEHVFPDNNSILKLSILPDKLIKQLQSLPKTDKGYVKVVISKTRDSGKYICYHDDFVPKPKSESAAPSAKQKSTNDRPF